MRTRPRHLMTPHVHPGDEPRRGRNEEGTGMSHGYSPGWRKLTIVILRPLLFGLLKRDWRGRGNVPGEGGVIIAANHISESDPLALAHFVYESGRYPVYLAKSTLFDVK